MISVLNPNDFYAVAKALPLIDVRSPLEFSSGHIPGARNIFLFDDDERALLGYLYVKKDPEEAIRKGRELANGRLNSYLDAVGRHAPAREVAMYCWRGGLRSQSFAALLSEHGFSVSLLKNGYKAYRNEVQQAFARPLPLIVVGGMTGSGKTKLLQSLAAKGHQVLDLESLACHKGSVFGAVGQGEQPTTQQFENNLYDVLLSFNPDRTILVEDENIDLGTVRLPGPLWHQIRRAPMVQVGIPRAVRIQSLVDEYAAVDDALLQEGIRRIERRLGHERARHAAQAVTERNYERAADLLLVYYDEAYANSIRKRNHQEVYSVSLSGDVTPKDLQQLGDVIRGLAHRT